jgi:hypothetical protein
VLRAERIHKFVGLESSRQTSEPSERSQSTPCNP